MSFRVRGRQSIVALLALALLLPASIATAQEPAASPAATPPATPQFNIQPVGDFPEGYFTLELNPGEEIALTAVVGATEESAPVELRAYRTNAINVVNGGFGAGAEEDPLTGASTWVNFETQAFALAAGERQEIAFTVAVPEGTEPGQYVAALVAQTDGPIPIPGMETFNQVIRSALGITIVVPGPETYGFELGTPSFTGTDTPQLTIPITNTGNYAVRPAGELVITDAEGEPVATLPVVMKAVYGGYTTALQVALPAQLPAGDYNVSGTLTDEPSKISVTLEPTLVVLAESDQVESPLTVDTATISPVGDPIQYADVALSLSNAGDPIPTVNAVLRITRDGTLLEEYPLAQNQALPGGPTTINQRYIPAGGWQPGTYTFEVVVSGTSLDSGSEVILASTVLEDTIVIP